MSGVFGLRCPAVRRGVTQRVLTVHAEKKGFGKSSGGAQKNYDRRDARFQERLDEDLAAGDGAAASKGLGGRKSKPKGDFWFKAADLKDLEEKGKKAFVTAAGRALMLYYIGGKAYCSDANSTAYAFPLIDATVAMEASGPTVTVPLDGTKYDLGTGRVIEWCPKNNPLRSVLGVLKATTDPVNLPVFECVLTFDDEVYVRLTKAIAAGSLRTV